MKKNSTLILAVWVAATWLATPGARAQNGFTSLHSFDFTDGYAPYAGVVLSGSTLYGTTERGGSAGAAVVFMINTNGSGFTNIISFGGSSHTIGGVVASGSTLYGTTINPGVVFAVSTNGTGLTTLHDFGTGGGQNPEATLTLAGGTLYGTTSSGDNLFKVNTDSTGFTNLYNFSALNGPLHTNNDGAEQIPAGSFAELSTYGSLIVSGTTLYGTAVGGGTGGTGTIFEFNTFSSNFTTLYSFSTNTVGTNNDGANPCGTMVLSGGTLFGTTAIGGSNGNGGIFRINTDGSHFTNLYSFSPYFNSSSNSNSDGADPLGGLVLSGGTLYGTAFYGGATGNGTVFRINTNGTGFTILYSFSAITGISGVNSDGANPMGAMALAGGILYGTTQSGGASGDGTVFAVNASAPPVPLSIRLAGPAVVLTWSNPALFLQSATTPTGTYTNVIGASSPSTNTITGSQAFYRLESD